MNLDLLNFKNNRSHFPVLIKEVISLINSNPKVVIDCTFGAGGYSNIILKYTNAKVIAIDRDENVLTFAKQLKKEYPERFFFVNDVFSNISQILKSFNISKVDVVVADLGVSTMQLQQRERGFSFQHDGCLSMTMGLNHISAYDFVNNAKESVLSTVIWEYGEEPKSRSIAKAIVEYRKKAYINTTYELRNIIHSVLKYKVNKKGKDSATKTFQAIRIHVNEELIELIKMLNEVPYLLDINGKFIVVTFHSLEDRIVKIFFNDMLKLDNQEINHVNKFTIFKPKDIKIKAKYNLLNKKVITPTQEEVKINKNSSCAKLRALQRVK